MSRSTRYPSLKFLLAVVLSVVLLVWTSAGAADKTFMWRVQSTTATAYLLGSVHMMKPEMYPLDQRIEQAFSRSDTLVVEVDVTADTGATQQAFLREAMYRDNDIILNHISKSTFEMLRKKFLEFGVPVENMLSFRPWSLGITLQVLMLQKLGYNPEYGIDLHFLKSAKGSKQIVELESADFQIKLLTSLDEMDQEFFLIDTIRNSDILKSLMRDLMSAWARGDEAAVREIMFQSLKDEPRLASFYEKFIFERNRTMSDRIAAMLQTKGTYFVVIGAGHLVGDKGVVRLLERKGYSLGQQ
jgi:uncharacterized protein YbaP (TraB family)